jgi:hypothetical protein
LIWKDYLPLTRTRKIAISVSIIFLSYLIYSNFRHAYFRVIPGYKDYNPIIDNLREILKWGPIILLILKTDTEFFERVIFKGIFISIIILVFSGVFAGPLASLGFKIGVTKEFEYQLYIKMPSYMRNSGFLGDGDFNVLGAFYNLILAFILSYFDYRKIFSKADVLLCFIFSILGVILTGSRMAFITFIIVILIFLLRISSFKLLTRYFLLIIITILVLYNLGMLDFILDRFHMQNSAAELSINSHYSRANRWISFYNYSTSRIERFLFGYDSIHYFIPGEYNDPHNLYLRMLYYGGVFFVILLIFQFVKLTYLSLTRGFRFSIFLILIPCFISSMIISQHIWIYYLLLIISINDLHS